MRKLSIEQKNGFLMQDALIALVAVLTAALILSSAVQALKNTEKSFIDETITKEWFYAD